MGNLIEFPKAETWTCLQCEEEFPVPKGYAVKHDWIVPCPNCQDVANTVKGAKEA